MLKASDFYNMPELYSKCVDFLFEIISTEHVLNVLSIAHTFGLQKVLEKSFSYIDNFIEEVLDHQSNMEIFLSFEIDLLVLLLKRDTFVSMRKNCLIFSPCGLTPKAGILVVGIIFALP